MKHQYKKIVYELYGDDNFAYKNKYVNYYRHIATTQERRFNCRDNSDRELRELGYFVRGRRRNVPTAWSDLLPGRNWKKSWKDFTKFTKQWETGLGK